MFHYVSQSEGFSCIFPAYCTFLSAGNSFLPTTDHPSLAAETLGLRLQSVAKNLVAEALPLTTHKRHRVRIAALQAVRATMHQVSEGDGGSNGGESGTPAKRGNQMNLK